MIPLPLMQEKPTVRIAAWMERYPVTQEPRNTTKSPKSLQLCYSRSVTALFWERFSRCKYNNSAEGTGDVRASSGIAGSSSPWPWSWG